MPAGNLFVAFFGALAVGFGHVPGWPPLAPPPRPSLNEVVREYKRLGLTLPPPEAALIRIGYWRWTSEYADGKRVRSYHLGFRLAPPWPGGDPRYWFGSWMSSTLWFDPRTVEPVEPTPAALSDVYMPFGGEEYIGLAIACRLRGWDGLADGLYARAWERFTADREREYEPFTAFRDEAYTNWEGRLSKRGTDRAEVLRHLKALIGEDENLLTPRRGFVLSALETTLGHPGSAPGTVEALIDGLTEYWEEPPFEDVHDVAADAAGREPYRKLAERGFEVVPALLDHLGDDRLSRAYHHCMASWQLHYNITVGHLTSRLLYDLSDGAVGTDDSDRGGRLDPGKAREWFTAAEKVGEERWLLDHALPAGLRRDPIVRVIGAKYPARLPALYRAVLAGPSDRSGDDYVGAILASRLPRGEQIALLEEGATHDDIDHRVRAVGGLAAIDPPRSRDHLLRTLRWLRDGVTVCPDWFDGSCALVWLVKQSGDPACWDALADLARQGGDDLRMTCLWCLHIGHPIDTADRPDPARREKIRFAARFLNDRTVGDVGCGLEIRDAAAVQLADLLRFPCDDCEWRLDVFRSGDAPRFGPFSRLFLRESVRAAAERELTRPWR